MIDLTIRFDSILQKLDSRCITMNHCTSNPYVYLWVTPAEDMRYSLGQFACLCSGGRLKYISKVLLPLKSQKKAGSLLQILKISKWETSNEAVVKMTGGEEICD